MTGIEVTLKVREISEQNPFLCMQCGLCSAGCTGRGTMDILPRQVMRMLQYGGGKLLDDRSFWICTTCLTCTARCPRGIDIARVMEALRAINQRRGVSVLAPEDLAAEVLADIPQMALTSAFRKLSA